MVTKIIDSIIDFSPFQMEIVTKIPIYQLVTIICTFYWQLGHKSIMVIRDPNDFDTYVNYHPDKNIDKLDTIKKISISTYKKKENKQKFDSVIIHLDKDETNKSRIHWKTSFGFKSWNYVYIIVALILGFVYVGKLHTTGLMTVYLFILSLFPMFLISSFRIRKVAKDPSVEKYKREFKEHIQKKERELLHDGY
ncbi:MAG: hypothetical protein PWQ63_1568 [Methanolobus sp.]|nr:hypothetical protein [Methanolobus sp.]MDK2948408.1 hypothetical protein [Methanolobus sp.]